MFRSADSVYYQIGADSHGDLSMIERVYYHPDRSKVQRKMSTFGDDLLADHGK